MDRDERVRDFLKGAGLPSLSEVDTLELDRPIKEEEIYLALDLSPPGKSPRPDGFTSLFYKKCKNSLVPRLCQVWNGLGTHGEFCEGAFTASVTLILKDGKDC